MHIHFSGHGAIEGGQLKFVGSDGSKMDVNLDKEIGRLHVPCGVQLVVLCVFDCCRCEPRQTESRGDDDSGLKAHLGDVEEMISGMSSGWTKSILSGVVAMVKGITFLGQCVACQGFAVHSDEERDSWKRLPLAAEQTGPVQFLKGLRSNRISIVILWGCGRGGLAIEERAGGLLTQHVYSKIDQGLEITSLYHSVNRSISRRSLGRQRPWKEENTYFRFSFGAPGVDVDRRNEDVPELTTWNEDVPELTTRIHQ